VIDRSKTRDAPCFPMAAKVAWVFGTLIAETILASVHVRARKQAEHMDARDLIRDCPNNLARRGPFSNRVSFVNCFLSSPRVTVFSAVGIIRRNIWCEAQVLQCPQRAGMQ
jgi:hypothetical protein